MPRKNIKKINRKDFIPELSRIKIPHNLILMPGERLLGNHLDFFVTNKRIIKHKQGIMNSKTADYSFKHIKGLEEVNKRPFLTAGLIIGLTFLVLSSFFTFFFILGTIIVVIAFWYKVSELVIYHIDGDEIIIPKIKDETAKKLIKLLRSQVYNKKIS